MRAMTSSSGPSPTSSSTSSSISSSTSRSTSRRTSRRTVLAAAGVGAGASLLPDSLHRAMAAPPRPGGLRAVEHVILLMQENRSFDHYYGRLRGVRGYGDRHPLRRRSGASVLHQPDRPDAGPGAEVLPFSLREAAAAAGRPAGDIQYLGALPHGFSDATAAWAEGWWDGWVPAKGRATMTYYDRTDVPLQYELAETFTTLDAYHCSVFGSTNPNRNYFWTGTTGVEPGGGRAVTNAAYSYDHPGYDWTTYPERLEAAGVDWRIYQEWDNFTDNAVEYFVPFKRIGTKVLAAVSEPFRTTEELYDALPKRSPADQERLLAELERGRASLTPAERSLFDRAVARSRPGTLLERLRADVEGRTLPRVSWIVPPAALSEHPGASTPVGSAHLVHDLLDLVASDRHTWERTVVLINFDENDGFFDHVPPPVPPRPASGEGDDWTGGRPIGLGPRVPMTIVSPWTVGGFVDSAVADHTSTLRFLERVTGVREPNISPWRREVCSDLVGAFDFEGRHRPPVPASPAPVPAPIERWQPTPPSEQHLPTQEPGRRPARALPYRPAVSAAFAQGTLDVRLANAGRSVASFTLYPYVGRVDGGTRPVSRPVRGVESLAVTPVDGAWDVLVQGPGGFWSGLRGRVDGAAAGVDVAASTRRWRADLGLTLSTTGRRPVRLVVTPLAYRGRRTEVTVRPGRPVELTWPTDAGWYDVEVTCPDDPAFARTLTGRVETGRPTRTA